MARGVNKAIIVGNLGNDPDMRAMPSGDYVANFSVATTESYKDRNGEQVEKTEWHRCVAFGRTAEIIGEYLRKGSQVYIEGSLQTRKWEDRDGNERYTTEIKVRDMQMLGSRGGSQGGGSRDGGFGGGSRDGGFGGGQQDRAAASGGMGGGGSLGDSGDDIPF